MNSGDKYIKFLYCSPKVDLVCSLHLRIAHITHYNTVISSLIPNVMAAGIQTAVFYTTHESLWLYPYSVYSDKTGDASDSQFASSVNFESIIIPRYL